MTKSRITQDSVFEREKMPVRPPRKISSFFLIVLLSILAVLPSCGIFRAKPARTTDSVQVINNVTYFNGAAADAGAHKLDLFLPKTGKNWPTVVLIHGGAWVLGAKEYMSPLAYGLAENGFAVANVNYRLTPRVKHPGHIEDAARAVAWAKKNMKKYGADPDVMFIMGHSAGGHLAALAGLNGRFLEKQGIDPNKDLAGVVAISGVYRIDNHVLDPVFPPNSKVWKDASPIEHVNAGAPAFLILFAEHEMQGKIPLVAQAEEFHDALQHAGVDTTIREIRGVNHDTIIRSVGTNSSQTLPTIVSWLKKKS